MTAEERSMSEGAPEKRERLCQEQSTNRDEGESISEEKLEGELGEKELHLKKKREQTKTKRMQRH